MKRWIDLILPLIFFILFIVAIILAGVSKPRVLVVMSYSPINKWEKSVREGITDGFGDKIHNFNISYYYMDTKIHNSPYELENRVYNISKLINPKRRLTLILVDDNAQLVGELYKNNPHINIVFAGVNNNPYAYYPNGGRITGIYEDLPFSQMKVFIQRIFPKYKNILHLSDDSISSTYVKNQVENFDWRPFTLTNYLTNSYANWQKAVELANQKNELLLITHYHTIIDANGRHIAPETVIADTLQRAKVPMLGVFDFFASDGGPIAVATTAREQGLVAARLTMQIVLEHKDPQSLPFQHPQYFSFAMNTKGIQKNMPDVQIPAVYTSLAFVSGHLYDRVVMGGNE